MKDQEEKICRGAIYYVFPSGCCVGSEQTAGRPAIVVSNDKANQYSAVVEMVYLTTKPKVSLPTHVDIMSAERPSIALCEQIHSVSKSRIGEFIANCTSKEMTMVDGALCVSLGLEPQVVSEPKRVSIPEKTVQVVAKQEVSHGEAFWKDLYYRLIDKLIQAKGA